MAGHPFSPQDLKDLKARLDRLKPASQPLWGSMSADEMLHHLNLAIGSGLGLYQLPDRSNWLRKTLIRWLILRVLKGFPKGSKTPDTLISSGKYDFEQEKAQLEEILQKAQISQKDEDWQPHTYFGKMSHRDWGVLVKIHCDHHLRQFGV